MGYCNHRRTKYTTKAKVKRKCVSCDAVILWKMRKYTETEKEIIHYFRHGELLTPLS